MFNRPPRIQQNIKEYQLKIIPPQPLPAKPKINWVTVGLPVFAIGLVIALMFLFSSSTSGLSYLMFLPFILASVTASVINYRKQKSEYELDCESRRLAFDREIKEKSVKAEIVKQNELKTLENNNPSTKDCIQIAIRQETRLGERRPEDADFLSFRIGTGRSKTHIQVMEIPIENRDPFYNDLYNQADTFSEAIAWFNESPIICDLKQVGSIGVAGKINEIQQFGWASAIHLITHHWPADINIAAFCSFVEVENWRWLEKVAHRATIFAHPVIELRDSKTLRIALLSLEEELRNRKATIENMRSISPESKISANLPALVIFFDRISGVYTHAAFSLLLKEGRELGVYGIFLVDRIQDIPAECGATVSIDNGSITYKMTGPGKDPVENILPEEATSTMVKTFADALSAVKWLIPLNVTEPPGELTLLEMFPYSKLDDLPFEKWWGGDYPFGYLRAPIGKFSPTSDLIFDLNDSDTGHGPHGLIGGMTGSGKSELLKTLILSLALTHHPYDINFALIDYKGGGAFDEFRNLPHVVGVITDIQNHADYATRVVQSLSGEIKRRESILVEARNQYGLANAHIDEYRNKLRVRIPIPRLVIIFDEFAEFQERHPNESKRLINIARVGRSLGIHMILCTQNPMGKAVDQQVRDNSNFTICLKVKTPDTSKALINIPDAIQLLRGEAYFHVHGPQKFKVAYTAGSFVARKQEFGETVNSEHRQRSYLVKPVSEAQAIVQEIMLQTELQKIPKPPEVWPDPLPENLTLTKLNKASGKNYSWTGNSWSSSTFLPPQIPLGLMDDPLNQKQPVFYLQDNLIIFGPSGAGKSISLLTIAMNVSLMYSPKEAWIYCIDISGQSPLKLLNDVEVPHLPKKGGVISGNDTERINRLFNMLRVELTERAERLRVEGRTSDIAILNTSNTVSEDKKEPYIFVLIDGINQQFNATNPGFKDQVDFVARRGPSLGLFIIITGNNLSDVPTILQNDISQKVFLNIKDRSAIGQFPETYQKKIEGGKEPDPGRGLINTNPPLEFQCGLPGEGSADNIIGEISAFYQVMAGKWTGCRALDVEALSYNVSASDLKPGSSPDLFLVGKSQELLEPSYLSLFRDGPIFMVLSMTAGLGKTSAIYLWVADLVNHLNTDQLKLVLIDYHTRTLRYFSKLPHIISINENVRSHVTKKEDLNVVLDWLRQQVNSRRHELERLYSEDPEAFDEVEVIRKFGYILIVIDDYEAFFNSKTTEIVNLTSAVADGEEVGIRLIFAEDIALLPKQDELVKRAMKYGCGVLLGGSEGLSAFNGTLPPYGQKIPSLPVGRGYIVRRSQAQLIQAATYWSGDQNHVQALKDLLGDRK